jgi:hypothetical protein
MSNNIIRKGQRKPFNKAAAEVMEDRVTEVEAMLRAGPVLRGQLIRHIRTQFNVEYRMASEYIARARDRLILAVRRCKEDHRADSLSFYEGMIVSNTTSAREKLSARERIDKLLGLENPQQIEMSGRVDTGMDIAKLGLDLATRKKLLEAVRKSKESSLNADD